MVMEVIWMVHVWLPGIDLGCGGKSLWVTAEQQLDRIPQGAWIDDREKQRKGEGGRETTTC